MQLKRVQNHLKTRFGTLFHCPLHLYVYIYIYSYINYLFSIRLKNAHAPKLYSSKSDYWVYSHQFQSGCLKDIRCQLPLKTEPKRQDPPHFNHLPLSFARVPIPCTWTLPVESMSNKARQGLFHGQAAQGVVLSLWPLQPPEAIFNDEVTMQASAAVRNGQLWLGLVRFFFQHGGHSFGMVN